MSSITTMLGLPMTHYVMVDMDGLAALIDALGGVTVDVGPDPLPIGGVTYSGRHVTPEGYVPAGIHHLDGDQALWFARSRRNSDDYDRMGRQRCLIGALVSQKSPGDVVAHFRQVTAAAAASISTNIPQSLLPALLALADEHRPVLRSVAFDPDLPDPVGRPRAVRSGGPGRRVHAAGRPRRAGAAGRAGTAPAPVVPAPSSTAGRAPSATASRRTVAGAGLRGVELLGPLLSGEPVRPEDGGPSRSTPRQPISATPGGVRSAPRGTPADGRSPWCTPSRSGRASRACHPCARASAAPPRCPGAPQGRRRSPSRDGAGRRRGGWRVSVIGSRPPREAAEVSAAGLAPGGQPSRSSICGWAPPVTWSRTNVRVPPTSSAWVSGLPARPMRVAVSSTALVTSPTRSH